MPVELDSKEWEGGHRYDPLSVEITDLLHGNTEEAYSIEEIDEYLVKEHSSLFPSRLVGEDSVEGAKAARHAIVMSVLERRYWQGDVSFRFIEGTEEVGEGLYFRWVGGGFHPIAELDGVKDVDSDSSFGKLSSRFRQIESDFDDDVSDLEERISYLEYRVREELGN